MGPVRGAQKKCFLCFFSLLVFAWEALTYFQWMNFVTAQVPPGKRRLLIYMDETALAYSWAGQKGTVICQHRIPQGLRLRPESVNRNEIRGNVTHMAFICDDSAIQPRLPQIWLGNKARFTLRLLQPLQGEVPANVHLWRQESSWNNHATMRKALSVLWQALQPFAATHYIVLLLDVARVHIHPTIYRHAQQCGLRLVYIPARLTRLLQPCDTHLFARFKAKLRRRWLDFRLASADGDVSPKQWVLLIAAAIREVFQGNKWAVAFAETGASDLQLRLSSYILRNMGLTEAISAPSSAPLLQDVRGIFPKRLALNVHNYVHWPPAKAKALPAPPKASAKALPGSSPSSPALAIAAVFPGASISSRTRSQVVRLPKAAAHPPPTMAAPSASVSSSLSSPAYAIATMSPGSSISSRTRSQMARLAEAATLAPPALTASAASATVAIHRL